MEWRRSVLAFIALYRLKFNIETFDRFSLTISSAFNVLDLFGWTQKKKKKIIAEGKPYGSLELSKRTVWPLHKYINKYIYPFYEAPQIVWTVRGHHAFISLPRSTIPFGHMLLKRGIRIDFRYTQWIFAVLLSVGNLIIIHIQLQNEETTKMGKKTKGNVSRRRKENRLYIVSVLYNRNGR